MKLGLQLPYWRGGPPSDLGERVATARELGFDSMWSSEGWGADAITPLAWFGARAGSMTLGTNIVQLSARTPAATAMAAMTMDHLTDGRFTLGLGASGPQVVEGWYGQSYPRPLERTREYVQIVRRIVAREEPVTFDGAHYVLPHAGGAGLGKPLKSSLTPNTARPSDLPRGRGAEERRARRRDRRRLAALLPLPEERCLLRSRARRRIRASRRAPDTPRLRGRRGRPDGRHRRPAGRARQPPAPDRPVHRRHGRARGELPSERVRATGL